MGSLRGRCKERRRGVREGEAGSEGDGGVTVERERRWAEDVKVEEGARVERE